MNCAIYIRKSREDKDKPSQRLTVQREQLPAYASSQGWGISIYDDGHASAAQGKTEALKERARLESDIRAGKINVILTIELSRLSRDDTMQDYVAWLTLCADHGVRLATLSRILDPEQHSDWMLLLMEGGFSSVEMKVLKSRMVEGRNQAYRSGKFLGGGCPAPYIYDKAQGRPVIDPVLLNQAQHVWKLAETMSARALAMQLGMPLISTRRMLADDRLLFCQALRLDHETGDMISCDWQPCMDAEQAERIRAARRKGYTGPRRNAGGLLSNLGILVCGYCESMYRGFKGQTRKDGTWTDYYGCRGKETKGKCPRTNMIEQRIIDERVITNLLGTLDHLDNLKQAWIANQGSEGATIRLQQLKGEKTSLEQKKQRLVRAIADGIIDFAEAKPQMLEIKASLERLQKERTTLVQTLEQAREPEWGVFDQINEIFDSMTQDEQREIVKLAIKKIRVFPTYMVLEYRFPRTADGRTTTRIHLPSGE